MEKVIVFGIGRNYRKHRTQIERMYTVVALVDNDWELLQNGVQPVDVIKDTLYDFILVTPQDHGSMLQQLKALGVTDDKIKRLIFMPEFYESEILGYSYWGQHCEDLLLASLFAMIGIEKTTYMDLGANHPVLISNTHFLYKQGCRGINIDANPDMKSVFDKARPEDININVGVSVKEGTIPFYVFGEQCSLNTFSKSEAEKLQSLNCTIQKVIELPVVKLESIVSKYCPNGFPDFLDCDIEGLDYEVLKDYDLTSNGPKVICVEVRSEDIGKFDEMLKNKGYFRFCRLSGNNIYVQNKYSEILCQIKI